MTDSSFRVANSRRSCNNWNCTLSIPPFHSKAFGDPFCCRSLKAFSRLEAKHLQLEQKVLIPCPSNKMKRHRFNCKNRHNAVASPSETQLGLFSDSSTENSWLPNYDVNEEPGFGCKWGSMFVVARKVFVNDISQREQTNLRVATIKFFRCGIQIWPWKIGNSANPAGSLSAY